VTMFRNVLTAVVITASVMFGSFVAHATSTSDALHYNERNGNGPTLVIRGAFATAEDMTTLRLVDYDPTHDRIVYRVVNP